MLQLPALCGRFTATGPVAQRIRHLTTNQGIAGLNPARVNAKLFLTMRQDTPPTIAKALSTNYTQTYFTLELSVESHC